MRQLRVLVGCECSGRVRDAFAARGWEAWSADILPSESPAAVTIEAYNDMGRRKYARAHRVIGVVPGARHYIGDVRDLFSWDHPVNTPPQRPAGDRLDWPLWDAFLGFPPCTHLALSGARYWKEKQADGRQQDGADFFLEMTRAPAVHIAVENPVGIMGRKNNPLYRAPDQVIQPWWFGDPLVKATCLWLENLPLLSATHMLEDYEQVSRVATGGGSYRVDKARTGKANNDHEDRFGRAFRQRERNKTLPGMAAAMASQWGSYIEENTSWQ